MQRVSSDGVPLFVEFDMFNNRAGQSHAFVDNGHRVHADNYLSKFEAQVGRSGHALQPVASNGGFPLSVPK